MSTRPQRVRLLCQVGPLGIQLTMKTSDSVAAGHPRRTNHLCHALKTTIIFEEGINSFYNLLQ